MKFKLDENLGKSAVLAFEANGHDTSSIHRQKMEGADDLHVFDICRAEGRTLITLDLDFANPLTFDPRNSAGVAVLRLSRNPSPSGLLEAIHKLLDALKTRSINNSLWIVRPDRIRVWSPTDYAKGVRPLSR